MPGKWSFRRCVNADCRLLWLDPQPIEEDIGQAYVRYFTHEDTAAEASVPKRMYRKIRASYLRSRLGYERAISGSSWRLLAPVANLHPGASDVFAASVMFLPWTKPGSSLLDIGSGSGDLMARMRELGWHVTGVETDPVAVDRARARGLDVHLGRLDEAGVGDSSFDAITMAHVVEHVHDPGGLLSQCRRMLKPDGRLVILTPNSASWGHRHFGRDWLSLDPPRHIHVFNPRNIRRLLESARLAPERIATLATNTSAVWPASAAIRRSRSSPNDARPAVSLAVTLPGVARQAAERLLRNFDPAAGEDLLAIATRTD